MAPVRSLSAAHPRRMPTTGTSTSARASAALTCSGCARLVSRRNAEAAGHWLDRIDGASQHQFDTFLAGKSIPGRPSFDPLHQVSRYRGATEEDSTRTWSWTIPYPSSRHHPPRPFHEWAELL